MMSKLIPDLHGSKRKDSEPVICVLEFNSEGHHLAYVEILIRALKEKTGQKPLFLTSAQVPKSKSYEIYLKPIEDRFEMHAAESIKSGKSKWMWVQFFPIIALLDKMRKRGIRRVLISTGDELAAILGLARLAGFKFKDLEITCGLLLLPLAYPTSSWLKKLKRRFFLWLQRKSGARLFCFDFHAVEILRQKYDILLETVPEPLLSLSPHTITKSVPKPNDFSNPLCLGTIGFFDPRKGVDLLLEAFQRAHFNRPVTLLLAGLVNDSSLMKKLKDPGVAENGKIQIINKILTAEEYVLALGKMDVLCMTYRSHVGPSGVYAQAASQGKIIVASDYGWLGWEGKKYNKILFFKDQSLDSLVDTLEDTVSRFDSLAALAGNYQPTSVGDFTKVFCSR